MTQNIFVSWGQTVVETTFSKLWQEGKYFLSTFYNTFDLNAGQTRMKVDESWQSQIVTGDVLHTIKIKE